MTPILLFAYIASLTLILCAVISYSIQLTPSVLSLLQHFAAGLIFASVAAQLVPELLKSDLKWDIGIGFALGVAAMLGIRHFNEGSSSNLGLIVGFGLDLWIDGMVIGLAFLVSKESGLVLSGALCLEVAFLAFALMPTLKSRGATLSALAAAFALLAILIPFGAAVGFGIVHLLPLAYFEALLAFGVAALLYLVTEELLREAHQERETSIATAAFFAGFLTILLL